MDKVTYSRTAAAIVASITDLDVKEAFREAVIAATPNLSDLQEPYRGWMRAGKAPAQFTRSVLEILDEGSNQA